jgi:phosphoribosyl-dephospho-CoA transferase
MQLHASAARTGVRIDAQIDTPLGGFALAEFAAGRPRVLLRTDGGPRLVGDPWPERG